MKLKRVFAAVTAFAMCAALAGCGAEAAVSESAAESAVESAVEAAPETEETADAAAFAAAGTTSARFVVGTSHRPDHHQAHRESAQRLQCVFHHHFLWILSLY